MPAPAGERASCPGPRARHVIQQPPDLGRREIRVDHQTGLALNHAGRFGLFEAIAKLGRATALPNDGVVQRLARFGVPHHDRFALIGDPERRDLIGADIGLF